MYHSYGLQFVLMNSIYMYIYIVSAWFNAVLGHLNVRLVLSIKLAISFYRCFIKNPNNKVPCQSLLLLLVYSVDIESAIIYLSCLIGSFQKYQYIHIFGLFAERYTQQNFDSHFKECWQSSLIIPVILLYVLSLHYIFNKKEKLVMFVRPVLLFEYFFQSHVKTTKFQDKENKL